MSVYKDYFRSENWAKLNSEARLAAMNGYEIDMAREQGRQACPVLMESMEANQLGGYSPYERNITINSDLLQSDIPPYEAVETYLHEARHAYQHSAIVDPGLHNNPQEVADWSKNQVELGTYFRDDPVLYRWQPVEADANRAAKEQLDQIYQGEFQDAAYADFKQENQAELARDQMRAELQMGPNYEESVKSEVNALYEKSFSQQAELSNQNAQETANQASLAEANESKRTTDASYEIGM